MDFSKIDSKRIYLLCSLKEKAESLAVFFMGQGYETVVAKDSQDLYKILCEQPAGYVMVSHQLSTGLGRMMPDFILKRFNLPVMVIREEGNEAGFPHQETLPPEIRAVQSIDPHEILRTLQGFPEVYQKSFEGAAASDTQTAAAPVEGRQLFTKIKEIIVVPKAPDFSNPNEVMALHVCRFAGGAKDSQFIFGFPHAEGAGIDQALLALEAKVKELGGTQGFSIEKISDQILRKDFDRLTEKASESVLGNIEGQQVAVRFFEFIDAVEEMKAEIASDAVVLVPLEDWWTEVGLPCHAYYWMPQNGKRMLFVRPGGKLRLESLDRFQNSGVPTLAVDPTDFEAFRKMRNLVQSLGYQPRQGAAKYLTPAA